MKASGGGAMRREEVLNGRTNQNVNALPGGGEWKG